MSETYTERGREAWAVRSSSSSWRSRRSRRRVSATVAEKTPRRSNTLASSSTQPPSSPPPLLRFRRSSSCPQKHKKTKQNPKAPNPTDETGNWVVVFPSPRCLVLSSLFVLSKSLRGCWFSFITGLGAECPMKNESKNGKNGIPRAVNSNSNSKGIVLLSLLSLSLSTLIFSERDFSPSVSVSVSVSPSCIYRKRDLCRRACIYIYMCVCARRIL